MEAGFSEIIFDSSFPGIGVKKVLQDKVAGCYPLVESGSVSSTLFCLIKLFGKLHSAIAQYR